jgi:hypothetical protein
MQVLLLFVAAYEQGDEAAFRADFQTLIADSYSAPLPAALRYQCRDLGVHASSPLTEAAAGTASTISAADASAACGEDTACVVPSGSTLLLDGSLKVAALVVRGTVVWTDVSQPTDDQWLCAGYVAVEVGGAWSMNVTAKRAIVYVMGAAVLGLEHQTSRRMATYTSGARARTANRAVHHVLGSRAFGATGGRLELSGRPLRRTTSSWWKGPSTLLDDTARPVGPVTAAPAHVSSFEARRGLSCRPKG